MTCRIENGVTFKQVYNTENRISSIMKLASGNCTDPNPTLTTKWDYAYDGDGVRTSTLTTPYDASGNPLTASLTAYYFGGAYETRSNGSIFKYYSFGGQSVVNEYKPATSTWTLSYMLTDHLGSVVAITDASGALISQQRYLPFGGIRTNVTTPNSPSTDYGYTGQRNLDSDIGLMDYRARFYSPVLNRFIQPDSIIPSLYSPQMLNRFSYVGNNPINFNDPTGHVRRPPKPLRGLLAHDRLETNRGYNRGRNGGGSSGSSGGNGGCNLECELNNELEGVVDTLYDSWGSNSDTGCNTTLLWNGNSNSWCHDNEFTQVACYYCDMDQALAYNLRFAYPLQWNTIPVGAVGLDGWVVGGDFFPAGYSSSTNWLRANGAVSVTNEGYTTTNSTKPSHIFHQGTIVQTLSQNPNGRVSITVNGQGENSSFWVAAANQYLGPVAFRGTDALMLIYATADQASGGQLVQLMDSIP